MTNTFISHTKASRLPASIGVIAALSNRNHKKKKNHLLSGFVWQSVGLYHSFYDRGDENSNADNISHASHIAEINFFSFSHSVITDWLVFSVISFGGE